MYSHAVYEHKISYFSRLDISGCYFFRNNTKYNGKKATPFQAGYDHGCSDAKITFSARYINQPGKGPSFHTQEFMSGYNRGFSACSGKPSPVASSVSSSSSGNSTSSAMYKQGYERELQMLN